MQTNSIGQAIRYYRKKKNLSQDDLARLSGVSYNTVVKLEKPRTPANPTIGTLNKMAKVLDVPIVELICNT